MVERPRPGGYFFTNVKWHWHSVYQFSTFFLPMTSSSTPIRCMTHSLPLLSVTLIYHTLKLLQDRKPREAIQLGAQIPISVSPPLWEKKMSASESDFTCKISVAIDPWGIFSKHQEVSSSEVPWVRMIRLLPFAAEAARDDITCCSVGNAYL
jgi:hypothetical protein